MQSVKLEFNSWFLLSESVRQIENLGYPVEVAKIFQRKFDKNAYLLAKWLANYYAFDPNDKNWWNNRIGEEKPQSSRTSINNALRVAKNATSDESARKALKDNGFWVDDDKFYDDEALKELRDGFMDVAEKQLFKNIFFTYNPLVKGIMDGSIDPQPYKKLNYAAAEKKYENKSLFKDKEPLIEYPDGYKWIDAGTRCTLLGDKMRNCGSVGVMSTDPAKKILALFDKQNEPHVMVTYSPTHKRISGEEGRASTKLKEKYDDYVLDLVNRLGAHYDYISAGRTGRIALKYLLGTDAKSLRRISGDDNTEGDYEFTKDGVKYYTNGNVILTQEQIDKAKELIAVGDMEYFKQFLGNDDRLATAMLTFWRKLDENKLGKIYGIMKLVPLEKQNIERGLF